MIPIEPSPVITVVQARFGSSRLPGKALKPLKGRPMLAHVLERAQAIGFPVWLATSETQRDDAIATLGHKSGVHVYRGIEWDVLTRMAETARAAEARIVIRLTGDCPCLAPDVARDVFGLFCGQGVGMASNDTTCSGWPDGLDVEVFYAHDLYAADAQALDRADREHVTPWLRRSLPHAVLRCAETWTKLKISVDCVEDLARVKAITARIPPGEFSWAATRAAILAWQQEAA
jgi:spore coat polysaccharide biosynthesis protein SpsF (cytidylyltransferase family)